MLYGRDTECGLIDHLVVDACRGRSGSLVLAGEAGIGKTALLEYAAGLARDAQRQTAQDERMEQFGGEPQRA